MKGLIRNPQLLWLTAVTLVDSFVVRSTGRRASWDREKTRIVYQPNAIQSREPVCMRNRSFSRKTTASNVQSDDDTVREKTINWLNDVVIGMNLCPFADMPMRKKQIQVNVLRGTDTELIVEQIWNELTRRVDVPGTTLIVCPELHPNDFNSYLDVLGVVQQILESEPNLEGHVQVAPFHPFFQFQGSGWEDSDNWTNRSPYPIFHILREDEVTRAVDKIGGDAGLVWKRNVELLEMMECELGTEALEQIMTSNMDTELTQKKSDILRRMRMIRNATDGNTNATDTDTYDI